MRRLTLMVVTTVLIGMVGALAWVGVTHRFAYVVTNGVSMQPLYHADDLLVVSKKGPYGVGDIVAYKSGDITVLHRIIDGDATGFVTKGDNNESIDPGRPTSSEILGKAVLHIPNGGTWLRRAVSTPVIAAIVFLLVIGTGQTVHHHRRRRRRSTVAKTQGPAGVLASLSSPGVRLAAGVIAAVALLAVVLGGLIGTRPAVTTVTVQPPIARSMTFAYGATVPLSNAYDGTEVTSPDPVFRSVANTVDVSFAYRGPPGEVEVDARLSISNGWHSTVSLLPTRPIDGAGDREVVRLDLAALAARAHAGGKATGGRATTVAISIVPRVTAGPGEPFTPALNLQLTPQVLALETADKSLTVQDVTPAPIKVRVPQVVVLGGKELVSVTTARVIAAALLLAAILAAGVLLLYLRRSSPLAEDEQIRRQYGQLLVEAQPMPPATDRPIVEVTEFKTLAKLAQRYGLLILHWTADGSTTFMVHDDATAYRYQVGPAKPARLEQHDTPAGDRAEPARRQQPPPAAKDPLTDLAGRSLFEHEMQLAIETGGGERLCLMLIDVDNLDSINDEHGREAGDAVLIATADRLREAVRPWDLVARLGGNGFAVLFADVGPEVVDGVAERIVRMVHESMLMPVQVSLGLVQADSFQDAVLLVAEAKIALADAKAANTAHYAWFDGGSQPV